MSQEKTVGAKNIVIVRGGLVGGSGWKAFTNR